MPQLQRPQNRPARPKAEGNELQQLGHHDGQRDDGQCRQHKHDRAAGFQQMQQFGQWRAGGIGRNYSRIRERLNDIWHGCDVLRE